jgi:hypothetical protein
VHRRAQLEALLKRAGSRLIRFIDSFPDADVLLASPYRSGPRSGWIKKKG